MRFFDEKMQSTSFCAFMFRTYQNATKMRNIYVPYMKENKGESVRLIYMVMQSKKA